MLERIQQSIDTKGAKVRNFVNERRAYYPFHETYPHLPFEVYIAELPPNHTQPWHSHNIVEETIIPISGQVNIFVKGQDDKIEGTQLPRSNLFDVSSESIIGISIADDGIITLIIKDNKTGDKTSFEIRDEQGFPAGSTIHTLQNHSDQLAVVVVVKKTTEEELALNPRIFREDRQSH